MFAQEEVLFTIDGSPTYTDEFIYTFSKNNTADNFTKNEIDDYLDLYLKFKLKVKEARQLGLDSTSDYLKELNTYKLQLMNPYLIEKGVTDSLIMEAYTRMTEEVDVSHILINLTLNASPEDSMVSYKKISEIHEFALASENFPQLAVKYSEEPAVEQTKGHMGYFTAFQMVYPFESAAYNTPVDSISKIIRTRFGYHILKVNDRRPSNGKVQISHLMLRFGQNMSREDSIGLQNKIFELQDIANKGYNWTEMVKIYSEDNNSSQKGGLLSPFGIGDMIPVIAEIAFAMDSIGSISDPVMSPYGWHLLRLENIQPLQSFDELKSSIERRVARDTRSNKSQEALIRRLKNENGFKENNSIVNSLLDSIKSVTSATGWEYTLTNPGLPDTLFVLTDSIYTISKFQNFVNWFLSKNSKEQKIADLYNDFVEKSLINYEKEHLEIKYPDFKYLLNEYREGILLFNVMDEIVWTPSSTDTAGLKSYYYNNLKQYRTQESVTISIFDNSNEIDSSEFKKFIQPLLNDSTLLSGLAEREIKDRYPGTTVLKSGTFNHDQNMEFEIFKQKGIYNLKVTGEEDKILVVWKYVQAFDPEYTDIKGTIISDYQEYIENNWVNKLKAKYPVKMNKKELKKIYRRYEI